MDEGEALYRNVISHADDDAPRLVYADWLQENGRAHHAELIRVQCRLASLSQDHPEQADLRERSGELLAALRGGLIDSLPSIPGVNWRSPFRRGFPSRAHIRYGDGPIPDLATGSKILTSIVEETPVRELDLAVVPGADMAGLGTTPAFSELDGLRVSTWDGREPIRAVVGHPWPKLRRFSASPTRFAPEDFSGWHPGFTRKIRELSLIVRRHDMTTEAIGRLLEGEWPELGILCFSDASVGDDFATRLSSAGPFRRLHTLYLRGARLERDGVRALTDRSAFPSVTSLDLLNTRLSPGALLELSEGPQPWDSLGVMVTLLEEQGPAAAELARHLDLGRLRSLFVQCAGPMFLRALASRPDEDSQLRCLIVDSSSPDTDTLAELAVSPVVRNLTRLEIIVSRRHRIPIRAFARFLATLEAPNLRHLLIRRHPLGILGPRALAKNPSLGELRVLDLYHTGLTGDGLATLAGSPTFAYLEVLNVRGNPIEALPAVLRDPACLPSLVRCDAQSFSGNGRHPDFDLERRR